MSKVEVDAEAINNLVKITQSLSTALAGLIPKASSEEVTEKRRRGRPKKHSSGMMCDKCSESYMYCACADNPLNNKKKKKKVTQPIVNENDTIIEDQPNFGETPEDIIAYKPPVKSNKPEYLAVAKRTDFVPPDGEKRYGNSEPVNTKDRQQKFVDFANVGDRIPSEKYPERSERRPAVQQIKFYCSKGNHEFMAYASEYPNAFAKFGVAEIGIKDDRPNVVCDACLGNTPRRQT